MPEHSTNNSDFKQTITTTHHHRQNVGRFNKKAHQSSCSPGHFVFKWPVQRSDLHNSSHRVYSWDVGRPAFLFHRKKSTIFSRCILISVCCWEQSSASPIHVTFGKMCQGEGEQTAPKRRPFHAHCPVAKLAVRMRRC